MSLVLQFEHISKEQQNNLEANITTKRYIITVRKQLYLEIIIFIYSLSMAEACPYYMHILIWLSDTFMQYVLNKLIKCYLSHCEKSANKLFNLQIK